MRKSTMINGFKKAEYTLISVPWKKVPVFVKVRELSDLQIQAIGAFSLIRDETTEQQPVKDWRGIASSLSLQNDIVKVALVTPTFKTLMSMIGENELSKESRAKYLEIQKELITMPIGPQRSDLERSLSATRILFDLILPNDFTSAISEYVLGVNRTEIKLVTKDILLNCAVLQSRSGGRPSDYCSGVLSEFNKRDIDTQAFIALEEYKKASGK